MWFALLAVIEFIINTGEGATTFRITTVSITTLSIMTLSIKGLFVTLSITLGVTTPCTECQYAKRCYA
jgi:hypothetical protein